MDGRMLNILIVTQLKGYLWDFCVNKFVIPACEIKFMLKLGLSH